MSFEFKPVELGPKGKEQKRQDRWKHIQKTVIYMVLGAIVSLVIHFFINEWTINTLLTDEITNPIFTGAFIGLFITNSPCSRGKC